jgi:hypothetical protein
MATIREDIARASDWIAEALASSGYRADFSPSSLSEVDRFFEEHSINGTPRAGGLLSDGLGSRLFALGCYVGEVVRRSKGGEWYGDDSDPEVELNAELRLADGFVCWPIQRVMKRLKNGGEDGIAAYGVGFGIPAGPSSISGRPGVLRRFLGK